MCATCNLRAGRLLARAENALDNWADNDIPEHLRIPPRFYRNGRPLEEQVHIDVFDGAKDDVINEDDMNWWFSEGPDDLREEPEYEYAEEIDGGPVETINPKFDVVRRLNARHSR